MVLWAGDELRDSHQCAGGCGDREKDVGSFLIEQSVKDKASAKVTQLEKQNN